MRGLPFSTCKNANHAALALVLGRKGGRNNPHSQFIRSHQTFVWNRGGRAWKSLERNGGLTVFSMPIPQWMIANAMAMVTYYNQSTLLTINKVQLDL